MRCGPRQLRGQKRGTRFARARLDLARLSVAAVGVLVLSSTVVAQDRGNPEGEWRYWGADSWSTRYSPLDQVHAGNFEDLQVAWVWRGDNFGPMVDFIMRSTPIYANGTLYTVAGRRRTVVAIDPATGETLWTFREPNTPRWENSPRQNYGRGVAYHEIDGRGVIYVVTPGFFLHALDAETGRPLEGFGANPGIATFPEIGTVDMLADLDRAQPHDPWLGVPDELGNITTSSPPIIVDGVVIVGSSALPGMGGQSRIENIPGDILAYDARTGEHLWRFNVIPRPGEYGHETWENDAWAWSGNANAWAPLSADEELGIVYVPTKAPTNDVYGGFRPGDNLFGNSLLALDVRTGERVWHFQTIRHDVWDWDNPVAPILLNVTVDGVQIPAVVQATKQAFAFTFNRETGEPVWPIEDRPVPQSRVPGEQTSPTQPFPTLPATWELQGLTHDDLIDFTPELREQAIAALSNLEIGPLYTPPLHRDNPEGLAGSVLCPSFTGGTNIPGGVVADPESGIMYVASRRACSVASLIPGSERDDGTPGARRGRTVVDFIQGPAAFPTLDGLPIFQPPYGSLTAIDMNTGEHLWQIPNGHTPDFIRDHPLLEGIDVGNTGSQSHATAIVTGSLLMYAEGRGGSARFYAVDKLTGEQVGEIDLPAPGSTAPMTYLHEGQQYIIVPVAGDGMPGSLVALRLP